MKPLYLLRKNLRNIIYSFLIILPSILTGNIYSSLDQQTTTTNMIEGMQALTTTLYSNLSTSERDLYYALSLICDSEEFETLNSEGMSRILGRLMYYNPLIINAYVINKEQSTIWGVNNNELSHIDYNAHITSALSGIESDYSTFIGDKPFIQSAFPIHSDSTDSFTVGVLVVTYDLTTLDRMLQSINSQYTSLNAYVVDTDGRIVSSSQKKGLLPSTPSTIDLNRIKLALDYSPTNTFQLFDETDLNGIYYDLPNNNWTLLVTAPHYTGIKTADAMSWVMGLLSACGISLSEYTKKRRQNLLSIICAGTDCSTIETSSSAETHDKEEVPKEF